MARGGSQCLLSSFVSLLAVPCSRTLQHCGLRSELALHGLSSSSILGLRISLTSSKRLKYNKNLPGNRVRNSLAVGHIEEIGYCVRESCRVSLVKGEMRQPLVFCPLFFPCLFLLGERKLLSPAVCLTPPQPVQSDRICQRIPESSDPSFLSPDQDV